MQQKPHFKTAALLLICISLFTGCNNHTGVRGQEGSPVAEAPKPSVTDVTEATTILVDLSDVFGELNGTAVFYNATRKQYKVYNEVLANERRSPCSTFKIISSLVGLENEIITPENSTRAWSGESFWNEDWNRDIDFAEAFRTSCVWYYRALIDEIGQDTMQAALSRLQYGNCDISDWEGRLNTNNDNRALTGFWIESSLKISAMEQVQVMERIFGTQSAYAPATVAQLKQVMAVADRPTTDPMVYGKTGMGKMDGVVVDAWFTGFVEADAGNRYFCVYLGETDGANVSSTKAKEIAIQIAANDWDAFQ